MKNIYVMLAVLGAFMLTWMSLATVAYFISDVPTYKDAMSHGAVGFIMLIVGWIPAAVVGYDVDKKLEDF